MNPYLPQPLKRDLPWRVRFDALAEDWSRLQRMLQRIHPNDVAVRNADQQTPHVNEWRWSDAVSLTIACRTHDLYTQMLLKFDGEDVSLPTAAL